MYQLHHFTLKTRKDEEHNYEDQEKTRFLFIYVFILT